MIQIASLEDIKTDDIQTILALIEPELESRKQLFRRIHRKDRIHDVVFDLRGKKNTITFEKYILEIASGFLGGKAPSYSVSSTIDEEKVNLIKQLLNKEVGSTTYKKEMDILIDYITKYNDDATEHYDLVYDALAYRGAYEIIYENDENEIVYAKLDPLQTVALWDYNIPHNLVGIVNRHFEKDVNCKFRLIVEITDKNGTRKFTTQVDREDEVIDKNHTFIELKSEYQNHNWGDVPAVAIETDESIFESEVDTIIKYEQLIQNTANMFQYNDQAKLAIFGYEPQNPITKTVENEDGTTTVEENEDRKLEDKAVLDALTIYLQEGGDVKWVLKDINDNAIQDTLKTYIDLILMMAGVPNTFDLGFTNADNASAIDRKFFSLTMMTSKMMTEFKKQYLRRWELIFNRINLKKGTNYDFRDIDIDLPYNLPANESEMIDMWLKLRGLISDETVTERLPLGLDYTSETNKLEAQNLKNIQDNLAQMRAMSNSGVDIKEEEEKEEEKEDKVIDLTDRQKAQKLTADNRKEQEKEIKEEINNVE